MLHKFEQYKIEAQQTNAVYKVPFKDSYVFLKVYQHKHPRLRYEIRKFLDQAGFSQPVEYSAPRRRKTFEEQTIQSWIEYGYHVPCVIKNPFPGLDALPILVTEFIEGTTLQEVIKDKSAGWSGKGEKLEIVFREVNARHTTALARKDNRLFHIDANTRNIMFVDEMVYHVDFEMGRTWEPSVKCASREILKMLVCTAEDAMPEERPFVFELFREHYGIMEVYEAIRRSILGRLFQSVHRRNDRKKKKKNPGRVTLYDVLDYLEQ